MPSIGKITDVPSGAAAAIAAASREFRLPASREGRGRLTVDSQKGGLARASPATRSEGPAFGAEARS